MKGFFSNVWTKRFVSIIAAFYTVAVCYLSYYSIFYDIHIESRSSVCLLVSGVSIIALVLMLYTRKQLLTRISSFIILAAMLPVVLLYFEEKALLIPIVITGVTILLLSGAGEGVKTLVGTIVLLGYIFAALGYFLFTSFFVTSAKTEIVAQGESPSGRYRYSVINTEDTSGGSTAVYFEPNYADVEYPFVKFTLKNMEHICYQERPICEDIQLGWDMKTRQEVTSELQSISDSINVSLSDDEIEAMGFTPDSRYCLSDINVYYLMSIGRTASDVEPIFLNELNSEQLAKFNLGKEDKSGRYYVLSASDELFERTKKTYGDRIYITELDAKGLKLFNKINTDEWGNPDYTLSRDNKLPLAQLTDTQLANLGVSEKGDVLTFNGKVCFRYYVAELEDYFDIYSRKLSVDLLN